MRLHLVSGLAKVAFIVLLAACNAPPQAGSTTQPSAEAPQANTPIQGGKGGDPSSAELTAALAEYALSGLEIDGYAIPSEHVALVRFEAISPQKVDRREDIEYFAVTAQAIVELRTSGAEIVRGTQLKWEVGMGEDEVRSAVLDKVRAKKALEPLAAGTQFAFPITARVHSMDRNWIVDQAQSGQSERYYSAEVRAKRAAFAAGQQKREALIAQIRDAALTANLPEQAWDRFIQQQLDKAGFAPTSEDERRRVVILAKMDLLQAFERRMEQTGEPIPGLVAWQPPAAEQTDTESALDDEEPGRTQEVVEGDE